VINVFVHALRALLYLGKTDLAREFFSSADPALGTPRTAFALLILGKPEEAVEVLDREVERIAQLPIHVRPSSALTFSQEAAVNLRHESYLRALTSEAAMLDVGVITFGIGGIVCLPRLLGEAFQGLGQADAARDQYEKALGVCKQVHYRPDLALTRLDLAELLLEHYPEERDAAIEHLDFAISEFREMKMQPSLERALRHRGLLRA
jgi:tetratricopeptide (TPR) repeat protein